MKFSIAAVVACFFLAGCGTTPSTGNKSNKETPVKKETASSKKKSADSMGGSSLSVKCTLAKDIRTIEVNPQGKGCEVLYTKFGESSSIATSAYGNSHCEKIQQRVQGKLETAGFKCM